MTVTRCDVCRERVWLNDTGTHWYHLAGYAHDHEAVPEKPEWPS